MSGTLAVVANDTPEMRSQYERMATATLHVSEAVSPSEVNDLLLFLRNVLDIKYMAVLPPKNLINIRAPKAQMDMIIASLDSVLQPRPEVLLDVKAYEYDTDRVRQVGLNLPLDFEIFSITSELRRVLGSSAQSVIDQFERTGTIDPSTIDPSVLSKLQGSPLLKPFVFFGKGLGLTGITVPTDAGASLSASGSVVRNLENVTLRGADGEPSTFRLGTRVPILNGTFTSITLDAKNNATIGSTPSIQYEDLGVTLKSTPHLHSGENVTLNLELQLKSLGTQTFNNIPEISTREFKGTVTVKDGEPAIITGLLTEQETFSTSGPPGLAQVPGLRRIIGANGREVIHNEILVVVTPHIVRTLFPESGTLGSSR
jgi:type II secretory pathway component GspD/PulD (secretin)